MSSDKKFGFETVALDVVKGIDLSKKLAIVTGGGGGIGVETSRALAQAGAHVILAVRDPSKVTEVIEDIKKTTGNTKIEAMSLELSDLKSVSAFAAKFLERKQALHLLINNAGIMATPFERTKQGFESQFGVNHIGHAVLTLLLLPALHSGKPARVVNVSSMAHHMSDVVWADIHFNKEGSYNKWTSYGQSKTANIYFAQELNRRFSALGINSTSLHPGLIATGLAKHMTPADFEAFKDKFPKYKTIPQGAATSVFAAVSPTLEGKGGQFLSDCTIQVEGVMMEGIAKHAISGPENGKRLWKITLEAAKDFVNAKTVPADLWKVVSAE